MYKFDNKSERISLRKERIQDRSFRDTHRLCVKKNEGIPKVNLACRDSFKAKSSYTTVIKSKITRTCPTLK